MASNDIHITFEIEPIVRVTCMAFSCKHNLFKLGAANCDLKHITISKEAYGSKCEMFEKREEDEAGHAST